jgi:NAD dependent epimerase/dehydratase
MEKILVTGAGGFIGSHLVEELVKQGFEVKAFVRYNSRNYWGNLELIDKKILEHIEVVSGDITDPFFTDKIVEGMDTVFHLAALIAIPYSYIAPENYVSVNVNGTLNVLKACLHHNVEHLVHTSTSETYGTAIYTPINELHPLQAQSPYSATKIAADKLVESFYLSFNLPVTTVRPFNTFGPRQSARAVIPTLITQIVGPSKSVNVGSVHPVRDFTYVKDTARGFIQAASHMESVGKVVNVGTGSGVTIGEIADLIMKITNIRKEIKTDVQRIRPENSEVLKLICDNTLAKKIIAWAPEYSIEQGLRETIDYISRNLHQYKPDIYNI